MRGFLVVWHHPPQAQDVQLNDLAGASGRLDAIARIVQSALFLSHGMREDTECWIVAQGPQPCTIRIIGGAVRSFHPDERNLASHLQRALAANHPDPWFEEVHAGLHVAPFGLEEALEAWQDDHPGSQVHVLDSDGVPYTSLRGGGLFVLSDHEAFTDEEKALLQGSPRVSLGSTWYHGNHCVAALQIHLDGAT